MTKITTDQILDPIRNVLQENPGRTNNGECLYSIDNVTPNCIAAVALVGTGTPLEELVKENTINVASHLLAPALSGRYTAEALDLLYELQIRADSMEDEAGLPRAQRTWVEVLESLDIDPGV